MKGNILINCLLLCDRLSGVHHSIEQLVMHLDAIPAAEKLFVCLPGVYTGPLEDIRQTHVQRYRSLGTNRISRIWHENTHLLQAAKKWKIDLFHGPAYTLPLVKPARKTVVTVHDLIALDNPELCQKRTALYFNTMIPIAVRRADYIIAVSHTVKERIIQRFGIPEWKIGVIYHGIGEKFKKVRDEAKLDHVRRKYSLPRKFILFLGNLESKKNIYGLIEAFRLLRNSGTITHKLVLAGRQQWGYPANGMADDSRLRTEILHPGYIDDEDIASLYTLASLFVFPSFYEGFGMPPLEAMACETPVITSDGGALPEITGNICPAVDPMNSAKLAASIDGLFNDSRLRQEQIAKGKEWVKHFTWQKAAKETLEVYKTALER